MATLVTGASGFIGTRLLGELDRLNVKTVGRTSVLGTGSHMQITVGPDTDYGEYLAEVTRVIHCSARVHVMNDQAANPLDEFRTINVHATLNLAQQAARAGVKRFIYLSSIKVNGESTTNRQPFKADDPANPQDPYGQSKYEAEVALRQLAKDTGLEVVIIRPPMVYGPDVKGNMRSLMKLVSKGLPLPLGGIKNSRSLVAVDNLVSLIKVAMTHPKAANQTFLVSDGEDLSTYDLIREIAKGLNKRISLVPIPVTLLSKLLSVVGKGAIADRLFGSLQVDITKTKELLDWEPPISVEEGIRRMCEGHKGE